MQNTENKHVNYFLNFFKKYSCVLYCNFDTEIVLKSHSSLMLKKMQQKTKLYCSQLQLLQLFLAMAAKMKMEIKILNVSLQ